jgi:hypothetical protein
MLKSCLGGGKMMPAVVEGAHAPQLVCSGDAQRVTSRVEDEVARDGVYLGFPVLKATFVVSPKQPNTHVSRVFVLSGTRTRGA